MNRAYAAGIVAASMIAGGVAAHVAHTLSSPPASASSLPDRLKTPGVAFREVTREQLCVPGYARSVRHVTEAEKARVFALYGIKRRRSGEYEIDHLISLELGGTNDVKNLWPQPYNAAWNARMKDALENKLHKLVCDGDMTLDEAQEAIRTDWVEAYKKHVSK